mgnify:FL=1
MSANVLREVEKYMSEALGETVRIESSTSLGGGCINHASKLQTTAGNWFMKWNANCPADMFEREAEAMIELGKAAGSELRIPGILCHKSPDSTPGFLVMEYLPPGRSSNDDEKLGRGLATVHSFKSNTFGFYHDNYCGDTPQHNQRSTDWLTFFRNQRLSYLLNLIERDRGLSSSDRKVYDRLLDRLPKLIPGESEPVLIHGDLWSGNYMLTADGPALIDPAAYYADREMEFAIVTMFGGFSSRFFEAYNEAFSLASDWQSRNKLYQLYHILNHYYLFGGGYGAQALSVARSYL